MTMADETGAGASLVERVKRILLEPNQEWDRIDAEPMTVGGIFKNWVFPLALIPALATLVGMLVFGISILGVVYRPSIGTLLANAVTTYVFTTSGVFLYGLLIDALAPTFNGTQNRVQAQKVSAYSATPAFIAGILGLIPQLSILALLGGLYGVYLIYLGLPRLMKVPEDKTVPYIATVIGAGIVIVLIAGFIIGRVSAAFAPSVSGPYLVS
jgi:Yip1-like protein